MEYSVNMRRMITKHSEEERRAYFSMLNGVREAYIKNWTGKERQTPYKFGEWFEYLTPIERNVWSDIRSLGLPFYPQFPVGKYYIDFADPFRGIAIEVDGRIHDEQSVRERDNVKEMFLKSRGWMVLRIPGYTTYKSRHDYENDDPETGYVNERYWTHCSEGILEKLADVYYRPLWRSEAGKYNQICLISSNELLEDMVHQEKKMPKQIERNKVLFGWN